METSVISEPSFEAALETLGNLLRDVELASIEYFNTLNEGVEYYTFKVSYQI